MKFPLVTKKKLLIAIGTALLIVLLILLLLWIFVWSANDNKVRIGAVVTNGRQCSHIGTSILSKGGSAADAAIAALFCEGVSMPQSMGLGGGFLLTIYNRETGQIEVLNARETAPAAATRDMFNGDPDLLTYGGLAVAVPGELKGYWYLHRKYGRLPWNELIEPTIELCTNGIYVTSFLAAKFLDKINILYKDPLLRDAFIDPATNSTYVEGQYVKRLKLANTLKIIAVEGVDALYSRNGSLAKGFVNDIQTNGGIITIDDLVNYEPVWQEPIKTTLSDGHVLYTVPPPGSGVIMTFILNILDGFLNLRNLDSSTVYQRLVESFKFGYGERTKIGDDKFVDIRDLLYNLTSKSYAEEIRLKIFDNQTNQNASYYGAKTWIPDDHGTAHICILASNGDAVSVTSTINLIFGAGFASSTTGIILNNQMDDFSSPNVSSSYSIPPSEANFIAPGKRPLSSMVPSIILKNGDVVLVTGAAGGTKITTTVSQIIIKHLWYKMGLQEAIDEKRVHHQLFPMMIEYEEDFNDLFPEIVNNLTLIGHESKYSSANGFSAATSISTINRTILAGFDPRRNGDISYLTN